MSAYFQANLLRGNDFHHTFLKGGWQSDTKAEKIRQNDVICEEAWKACAKVAAQPNLPSKFLFLFLDVSLEPMPFQVTM
jgi:hypothetical protein